MHEKIFSFESPALNGYLNWIDVDAPADEKTISLMPGDKIGVVFNNTDAQEQGMLKIGVVMFPWFVRGQGNPLMSARPVEYKESVVRAAAKVLIAMTKHLEKTEGGKDLDDVGQCIARVLSSKLPPDIDLIDIIVLEPKVSEDWLLTIGPQLMEQLPGKILGGMFGDDDETQPYKK